MFAFVINEQIFECMIHTIHVYVFFNNNEIKGTIFSHFPVWVQRFY